MPAALRACLEQVDARVLVLSYNDESWITLDELESICATRGAVATFAFDSKRYVGAQIGIHDPSGKKVGKVSHLRNQEYVIVCGEPTAVQSAGAPLAALTEARLTQTPRSADRGPAATVSPPRA